jgi:hypothetical protein
VELLCGGKDVDAGFAVRRMRGPAHGQAIDVNEAR